MNANRLTKVNQPLFDHLSIIKRQLQESEFQIIKSTSGLRPATVSIQRTLASGQHSSSNKSKSTSGPSADKIYANLKAENPDKSVYKSTEYYGFNEYSYYDIEKDMLKYRLPQPSSMPKIDYTWSQLPPKEHTKKNQNLSDLIFSSQIFLFRTY